ncbi:MAG: bifunctional nuclease family protein, partial [Deltaproteobacteria bacterium]|nr:bifunctional nuclease family protein [Deltaproteobacteria bacterium]
EKTALPIWIGLVEASAIATELEKISLSRPMTHDLMMEAFRVLGAKVEKVTVSDLCDNTFYAQVHLSRGKETWVLDSRPSDALALALRSGAPILVSDKVVEKSRRIDLSQAEDGKSQEQRWTEILENLSPEDFGKYKM